jgi:hypothetical protein
MANAVHITKKKSDLARQKDSVSPQFSNAMIGNILYQDFRTLTNFEDANKALLNKQGNSP